MKQHTTIYPRGTDSWWCGGYVPVTTGGFGGECIHATATAAEVCERNPTRYRSPLATDVVGLAKPNKHPGEGMLAAFAAAEDAILYKETSGRFPDVTETPLAEVVEMLMGCASCAAPTRCAIGACLKAALAVRIVTDRLRHRRG